MRTRRILAALVGATMALTLAGAALATGPAVGDETPLNQTPPIASDDADFLQECTEEELGLLEDAGKTVAWHFILTDWNQNTGDIWVSFENEGDFTVSVFKESGNALHFYAFTDADTLLDAHTVLPLTGDNLNLSHICSIVPEITPSPSPTPTLPPTTTSPASPASPSGTSMNLVLGLILLIAGGFTAYAMRQRRSTR